MVMIFSRLALNTIAKRHFSHSAASAAKVTVLGAAGGIGQPLSLLLKLNPLVSDLALYDIRGTPGVAADLSHINTSSSVQGYLAENNGLQNALAGAEVVVVPAGVPRKPGMTRDDLFNTNASIVRDLAKAVAQYCSKARLLIISNPVNSMVPIVAEVFKKYNVYNPKKLFGVTTLDVVRASRFICDLQQKTQDYALYGESQPRQQIFAIRDFPVVGGHSGPTIVPIFSKTNFQFTDESRNELLKRIQYGGDEVVKAKQGDGSATLSMAYAGWLMTNSVLEAMNGKTDVVQCSYVQSDLYPECEFFSSPVELGREGIEKVHAVGEITGFENNILKECLSILPKDIQKGKEWITANWT